MRRVKHVTIQGASPEDRDKGKIFLITEMPAAKAEEWAMRALLAVTRGGLDIGDAEGQGMAGIARLGLQSLTKLSFEDLKPLVDEMFECVVICPDKRNLGVSRSLREDDIEEVSTRLQLRAEIFTLHTGFSLAEARLKPTSARRRRG